MSARSVDPLGRPGTIDHAYHLLADQLRRGDHQDFLDHLVRREAIDRSNVHEMAVLGLANLVQAMAATIRDRSDSDCDRKRWER